MTLLKILVILIAQCCTMNSNDLSMTERIPVVFTNSCEPQRVASFNKVAGELGIREGMKVDIIDYFCRGVILKIGDPQINEEL